MGLVDRRSNTNAQNLGLNLVLQVARSPRWRKHHWKFTKSPSQSSRPNLPTLLRCWRMCWRRTSGTRPPRVTEQCPVVDITASYPRRCPHLLDGTSISQVPAGALLVKHLPQRVILWIQHHMLGTSVLLRSWLHPVSWRLIRHIKSLSSLALLEMLCREGCVVRRVRTRKIPSQPASHGGNFY